MLKDAGRRYGNWSSTVLGRRTFAVAVVGAGRIGLPHALVSSSSGNMVFVVDADRRVIDSLKSQQAHFSEDGIPELLRQSLDRQRFLPVGDISFVAFAEVIVVAVGVSPAADGGGEIDLTPILNVCGAISPYLTRGKLLVIRTTVPVGTTDSIKNQIEILTGLKEGKDYHLVFAPERLAEGRSIVEERTLPKIIGAYSDEGFELAKQYFETIGGEVIRVASPKVAELVKLSDNAWRQSRFAFSNDLALVCEKEGVDVLEVIRSANKGYPRNNLPEPSCGVSGYCLSKDPHILELSFRAIAKERGFDSTWHHARLVNDFMVRQTYEKTLELSRKYRTGTDEKLRLIVAGLTYKEDCDDFRMSHGVSLAKMLANDFEVTVYDPFLANPEQNPYLSLRELKGSVRISTARSLIEAIEGHDVIVFTVKHREFVDMASNGGMREMVERMRRPAIIVDGWNIFEKAYGIAEKARSNSLVYYGVGRRA